MWSKPETSTPNVQHFCGSTMYDLTTMNREAEESVLKYDCIFHPYPPAAGPAHTNHNDTARNEIILKGFSLWPNSIPDDENRIAFNICVNDEWVRRAVAYNDELLPEVSFIEAEGYFQFQECSSEPPAGNRVASKQRFLELLASVALNEAVKYHLVQGGDERLHLLNPADTNAGERGTNKYHCPPHPVPRTRIVRSSCTCSPPSRLGFAAARSCLRALWEGSISAETAFDHLRDRISSVLGVKTPHHVILHPSGTDAEFTALLAGLNQARRLGCSGAVNIVVGAKEVGSNTATAAGGKHFSKHFPVCSNTGLQDRASPPGCRPSHPAVVSGVELQDGLRVVELSARLADGTIVEDFDTLVLRTLATSTQHFEERGRPRPFFIMHVVDGSKLGSHITSRLLVEKVRREYGSHVLFVLDACQARTETRELDWYLSQNAVILVTGSKFYGAPGFCAAALVPHNTAVTGLTGGTGCIVAPKRPVTVSHELGLYITQLEVPSELGALREALPPGPANIGLLLRWSCGMAEMERFARMGQAGRCTIGLWVDGVRDRVRKRRPHLTLLRDTGCEDDETVPFPAADTFVGGVNSIVCFCVSSTGFDDHTLQPSLFGIAALRQFHRWLTMDVSMKLPNTATEEERTTARLRCYIGQPVDLGDLAVLRLAMGAPLASDLAEGSRQLDEVLREDGRVLDKILLTKKYYLEFCGKDFSDL